jgi:phenylalanyl-tRNA synthetase beta chain
LSHLGVAREVSSTTLLMLHGFGQPMHAYDLSKLAGSTLVARLARPGEKLVTLDGVERTLEPSMTVIADAHVPQGVAGVMGGRASEVSDATTDVLLEAAVFDPKSVRHTRRALGLSTDASYRFERGIDPDATPEALAFAVRLIIALAGGALDGAPIDVKQPRDARDEIRLRPSRVRQVLGVDVHAAEIRSHLESIGFSVAPNGDALVVRAPSWRADIVAEIDLVEEVARLHGYDALPTEIRAYRPTNVPDDPRHVLSRRIRDGLVGAGLLELRPMPFVAGSDETHVRVVNPLAENEAHLRRALLETLPRRAEHNLSHRSGDVRIFEIGSMWAPSTGRLPNESYGVAALIMGRRRPPHFTEPEPPLFDEWDAKGLAERLASLAFGGKAIELRAGGTLPLGVAGSAIWTVAVDGEPHGYVARLALDVPVSMVAGSAFGIEIDLGIVSSTDEASRGSHTYIDAAEVRRTSMIPPRRHVPLPTTPAAEFDLALVIPDSLAAGDVESAIRRSAGELLERLELFDHYRGEGIPGGHRSLAWRLTFRDATRTLRDKEVEGRRQKILQTIERELGVRPRT